jgi:outer membrane protein OmpA-like peptidoglycan-associated protein
MEYNMNSAICYAAAAFGINASADYNINSLFALGLNLGLSFSEITVFETAGLFRWYFLQSIFPQADNLFPHAENVFLQADAGLWAGTKKGARFLAGARVGIRLPLSKNFYVEPYARIGYPFMFGAGVAGGVRLPWIKATDPIGGMTPRGAARKTEPQETAPAKAPEPVEAPEPVKAPEPVEAPEPVKETELAKEMAAIVEEAQKESGNDDIWLEFDSEGRIRLMVSVVFGADSAEFKGLRPEIMANNERTFGYVADILKKIKYSSIIIEGHANPTSPEGRARNREENELRRLSLARALTVVDELRKYGVNLDSRSVQGAGSSRMVAPYNDAQNNWKNRRVEFILVP